MATVEDLIDETESHLTGVVGGSYNRLLSAVTTTTTQAITLEFDKGPIVAGSVIGIDSEDIFVLEADGTTITKAIRGFRGSTAATHLAGAVVQADPRFTRHRIQTSLKQEVASWGTRLYRTAEASISLALDTRGYDLDFADDNFLHVIEARVEPTTTYTTNSSVWPSVPFSISSGLDTADFSSGRAIFFDSYLYSGTSRRVRVRYAQRFDVNTWTPATELEATVGIPVSMQDIPPLGAAWRMMIGQEVRRSEFAAMGQSRRAEEVPPTAALQTAQALKVMRDQRMAEEQLTLLATNGIHGGF